MRAFYCDSSVFCAYFNDEAGRADIVEELLEEANTGEIKIVTSSFALVEVLKVAGHMPLTEDDENKIVAFFQYPFMGYVDATRQVCQDARHLIWKFPALQPKDSVHLACALYYAQRESLDGLFSYDKDFTKLDGKITSKFKITEPFIQQSKLKLSAAAKAEGVKTNQPPATPPSPGS